MWASVLLFGLSVYLWYTFEIPIPTEREAKRAAGMGLEADERDKQRRDHTEGGPALPRLILVRELFDLLELNDLCQLWTINTAWRRRWADQFKIEMEEKQQQR